MGYVRRNAKMPAALKLRGPVDGEVGWLASQIKLEAPWVKVFDTNGWLLPKTPGTPLEERLGQTCWNWKGHEHLLVPTHAQVVAKVLTATLPGHKTGSKGPFCLHFCTSEANCFESSVRLEQLTPGQWLTFKGIMEDREFRKGIPALGGIQIEAKSSEEWFCDRVKVAAMSDDAGGHVDAPMVEFFVNRWLDSPVETKEYPNLAKSSDPAKLAFVGVGPMVTVTAVTRGDVGFEAGSKGPFVVKICDDADSCLPTEIKLEGLLAGKTEVFQSAVNVPNGFSMQGISIQAKTDDAWFADKLSVTLEGQTLDLDLGGWFVSVVSPFSDYAGNPSFVSVSRFMAPGRKATAHVYTIGRCDGPLRVKACTSETDCEPDAISIDGPWTEGQELGSFAMMNSIVKPALFNAKYLSVENGGSSSCSVGWLDFALEEKGAEVFGPPSADAKLVPHGEVNFISEISSDREVAAGASKLFEHLQSGTLVSTTSSATGAGSKGPIGLAVCNAKGTKCLNKPIFLGGLTQGAKQTIPFSLPLAKVQEADPEWEPTAVYLEDVDSNDPWMPYSLALSSEGFKADLDILASGWVASGKATNEGWPGSFWNKSILLPTGGARVELDVTSLDGHYGSADGLRGAIEVQVCAHPGLCRGSVRLTGLLVGTKLRFDGPLGELPADFRKVASLNVRALSPETWCLDKVSVQVVAWGPGKLPHGFHGAWETFIANGCLTTDPPQDSHSFALGLFQAPLSFVSAATSLLPGGPQLSLEVETNPGSYSGSEGPFQVLFCLVEKKCLPPVSLMGLKAGEKQVFTYQLPELTVPDFKINAVRIKALTDDSWFAKDMHIVLQDTVPVHINLNGWFELNPNPQRHTSQPGRFVSNHEYLETGPMVKVEVTTSGQDRSGSMGPFDIVICTNEDRCIDASPIVLNHLIQGESQVFLGNVAELTSDPDFMLEGLKVISRTKDAWQPTNISAEILGTSEHISFSVNGWFEESPLDVGSYSDPPPLFAKSLFYLDECSLKVCGRLCQLVHEFDSAGSRTSTAQCICNDNEQLNADGRTCDELEENSLYKSASDSCVVDVEKRTQCGPKRTFAGDVLVVDSDHENGWGAAKEECDTMGCCFEATKEYVGCFKPDILKRYQSSVSMFAALETLMTQPVEYGEISANDAMRADEEAALRSGEKRLMRGVQDAEAHMISMMKQRQPHAHHRKKALEDAWRLRHGERGNASRKVLVTGPVEDFVQTARRHRLRAGKTTPQDTSTHLEDEAGEESSEEKVFQHWHNVETDPPPSIDYLGMGYNHIIGDPWGDEVLSLDPGFTYPVVSLSFTQERAMLDGSYLQPLEGWAVPTYSCYHSETSERISDRTDLQTSSEEIMERDVSWDADFNFEFSYGMHSLAGGIGRGHSFSSSSRMQKTQRVNEQKEMSEFYALGVCTVYRAALSPFLPWKPQADVIEALVKLMQHNFQGCNVCKGFQRLNAVEANINNEVALNWEPCSEKLTDGQDQGYCSCVIGNSEGESAPRLQRVYKLLSGELKTRPVDDLEGDMVSDMTLWKTWHVDHETGTTCDAVCETGTCDATAFNEYVEFFETYGTMIVTGVDMGSRIRQSILTYDSAVAKVETMAEDIFKTEANAIHTHISYNGVTQEEECDDCENWKAKQAEDREEMREQRAAQDQRAASSEPPSGGGGSGLAQIGAGLTSALKTLDQIKAISAENKKEREKQIKAKKNWDAISRVRNRRYMNPTVSSLKKRRKKHVHFASLIQLQEEVSSENSTLVSTSGRNAVNVSAMLDLSDEAGLQSGEMCWSQTKVKLPAGIAFEYDRDSGTLETRMDTTDAETEAEHSVSQAEMTVVGGLPPGGSDEWPQWAESTGAMPMPVRYTVVEFPLLFEKLALERLYQVGADSGEDSEEDVAQFDQFVEKVKKETTIFVAGFTNALETYSVLKGSEVPQSCQFDTIGDIKKWGNGGKVCTEKCRAFIWPSSIEILEPVVFVPGKFTGLPNAKKEEVQTMAKSTDAGKHVRVSKHCVGMIVTGMKEDGKIVEEDFFVNPTEAEIVEDQLAEILQVLSVEVIATEMPMPKGNVRFKLRKAPRGYETCLGFGPAHDLLDTDLDSYVQPLRAKWEGADGFDIHSTSSQLTPAQISEKELQFSELLIVFKKKIEVSLYASAANLEGADKEYDRAALGMKLTNELKNSCETCYQASAEYFSDDGSGQSFFNKIDTWVGELTNTDKYSTNLVDCKDPKAIYKWIGRKLSLSYQHNGETVVKCLQSSPSETSPQLADCPSSTEEYKAFQEGFHWLYDGVRIRTVGGMPPRCLGSWEGMCQAGTPMVLKPCDGNPDTVLIMEEFDGKGCAAPTLQEKIAKMLEETPVPAETITCGSHTHWGDWYGPVKCPSGSFAMGYRQLVEPDVGIHDNSALNAIQLKCSEGTVLEPHPGEWGEWTDWKECSEGNYINGYRLRSQVDQGSSDDTAANDAHFFCTDGLELDSGEGMTWGNWMPEAKCADNVKVTGISVQFEAYQGGSADDSALNDLSLICGEDP